MSTKIKTLGQVYTPKWVVNEILDNISYNDKSILDKYIMEPSCGDGVFLEEVVNRYINISLENNISLVKIISNLEKYIYAVEIDTIEYEKTIIRLNKIVENKLGFYDKIKWNIFNSNTLTLYKDFYNFFDFVVGNPPYIRIHNIDDETKQLLKKEFIFTNGSLDMYLIFFEIGINMLNEFGKLGYITPNTYFHNISHSVFRDYLKENKLIELIVDFKSNKVFKNFSTYTAITILSKKNNNDNFEYKELDSDEIKFINNIYFNELNNKKWVFSNEKNKEFIKNLNIDKGDSISDLFDVKYGFATLRDKIFIGKIKENNNETVYFNDVLIEKDILYKIVKASKFKGDMNNIEYIIFPYHLKNNRYCVLTEEILNKQYPLTYKYLLNNKTELLKRDIEKGMLWYEFGRSQGIQSMHNEKIIVNPMMGDKIKYFRIPPDVFIYSGIFIIKNKTYSDWKVIEDILESDELYNYIKITAKDLSGGFKSVTTKHIKEFKIKI